MRSIEATLFIALDGVAEAPHLWMADINDPDMGQRMSEAIDKMDTVLLGRTTYQEWSGYWPTSKDEPYATFINRTPKYVVSSTLTAAPWGSEAPAKILATEPLAAIAEMKRGPGRAIGVQGSLALVEGLLRADLLDRLTLMTFPVLAGRGKRLFNAGDMKRLKLASVEHSKSGIVYSTYEPARA